MLLSVDLQHNADSIVEQEKELLQVVREAKQTSAERYIRPAHDAASHLVLTMASDASQVIAPQV